MAFLLTIIYRFSGLRVVGIQVPDAFMNQVVESGRLR